MSLRSRLQQQSDKSKPQPPAPTPPPAAPPVMAGPAIAPIEGPPPPPTPPGGLTDADYQRLFSWLCEKMGQGLDPNQYQFEDQRVIERLRERFDLLVPKANLKLNQQELDDVFFNVAADLVGFGPIQRLLDDDSISEIMVNGPTQVWIERKGKLIWTNITFQDNDHAQRIIERIVRPLGRYVNVDSPMVDARLPDGSRVNAIVPPCAIDGPTMTIRKFGKKLTIEDLIRFGSMTPHLAQFLEACVAARLNIVVSGGTGSGKTTLLNVLSSLIPHDERIVTIEDSAELQLSQPHVVRLEAKPANRDGKGEITIRHLVKNSLRMRPERIVIGEVRGGEAIDMLQAMNTGHDGSLATLHANNPREAMSRIETMAMMSGMDLPIMVIRDQIARAVDVVVQQSRLRDGSRKITFITEVGGMEGDTIVLSDIFMFQQQSVDPDGKIIGDVKPTGIRPMFSQRLVDAGFKLPPEMFGASVADMMAQQSRRR